MKQPLLEIRDLSVRFGTAEVVNGVSFTLARGEKLAVIGESGSGKSVTAMSVMRLLDAQAFTSGTLSFDGIDILALPPKKMQALRGRRIAMVFQDPMTSLNPTSSVGAQLRDVLDAHGIGPRAGRAAHAAELLAQVGLHDPDRCLTLYPHELSGGMRQRVMIALALACAPDLLIADEPTTALDVTVQEQIARLLVDLCAAREIGLIFISHNLDLVGEFADRILVMKGGRIVEDGSALQVMGAPEAAYTRRLLAAIPRVATAEVPQGRGESATPAISATGVSKSYPLARSAFARLFDKRRTTALHPTDVTARTGEVLGIVGESGSGKSTLARLLIGLDMPDSGTITLKDRKLGHGSAIDRRALGRVVQLVFQGSQSALNPRKTIRRALEEAMVLAAVPDPLSAKDLMRMVHLDPALLDRYPHQLSGGQRQRVCIARALSARPEILIADEPTSALDVSIQKEIIDLLRGLQHDLGMTMIVISHDLGLVATLCDRVVVMQAGRIVESGQTATVLRAPREAYTKTLLDAVPRGLEGRSRFANPILFPRPE